MRRTLPPPVGSRSVSSVLIARCWPSPARALARRHNAIHPCGRRSPPSSRLPAVLSGVVTTDDERSAPIRRALVTVTGGAGGIVQTASDDDGRFTFIDLPAGSYALTAEKPGFVKTFVGSRRPGRGPSTPIELQDGQRLANVAIKLIRGAAIAGTVIDDNGQPVSSAQVSLLQPRLVNGERRLVSGTWHHLGNDR